jgi:hypothetical protein
VRVPSPPPPPACAQITAAAVLANLSVDRWGQEAVASQMETVLPCLWLAARALTAQVRRT